VLRISDEAFKASVCHRGRKELALKLFHIFTLRWASIVTRPTFPPPLRPPSFALEIYSSLLLVRIVVLLNVERQKKFHDENYKKCISSEFPAGINVRAMPELLSIGCSTRIYYEWMHVCIYGFMMINVYLYLCNAFLLLDGTGMKFILFTGLWS
jgi:hypothetical protein